MNLSDLFGDMKAVVEPIIETAPITYEWWVGVVDYNFAQHGKAEFVRHPKYPTIPVISTLAHDEDVVVLPIRLGQASMQSSTLLKYVTDEDLLPADEASVIRYVDSDGVSRTWSKAANINYQLKRGDKIVSTLTQDSLYVVSVHFSPAMTHLIFTLLHSNELMTTYGAG